MITGCRSMVHNILDAVSRYIPVKALVLFIPVLFIPVPFIPVPFVPVPFVLVAAAALAQSPSGPAVVTFNRADAAHCRVIVVDGKPLLETTWGGTSVAVGMPLREGNGEFSIFVSIAQDASATGSAEVAPKHFSAIYSDPAHTRFAYFDKARDLDTQASIRAAGGIPSAAASSGGPPPSGSANADSSMAAPDPTHPEVGAIGAVRETNPGTRSEEEARQIQQRSSQTAPGSGTPHAEASKVAFLRSATVKPGSHVSGFVWFRKPRGFKLEASSSGTLDEIDIPIGAVTFRF